MDNSARIVLSYARSDGEELAFGIHREVLARGLTCRLDRIDMKDGESWRRQFEAWIRQSVYLVLIMTPAALKSRKCAWEWQLARTIGRAVLPVRALPNGYPISGLRRWMRQAHQYDISLPDQRRFHDNWLNGTDRSYDVPVQFQGGGVKSVLLLLLLGWMPLAAQNLGTQPMSFQQLQSGEWQGKNVTSKEILAYVVEFDSTNTRFAHDYYFKPQGLAPNALEDFESPPRSSQKAPPIAMTGGKVLYLQFVDGTEWGEHAMGEPLLNNRQPMLRLISQMVDRYGQGGEEGFSDYLATAMKSSDATESGFAMHIWIMQQQSGIEGALDHLKIKLQSAAKHDKTLLESK